MFKKIILSLFIMLSLTSCDNNEPTVVDEINDYRDNIEQETDSYNETLQSAIDENSK